MMMVTLKVFLATGFFCFMMDMIWLGFISKKLYDSQIGHLLKKTDGLLTPNFSAAALVYIAIASGILLFVLPRVQQDYMSALKYGALFGMIVYGVYDFTNYSILKDWPLKITIIDFLWGTCLCGASAVFALFCKKLFT